MKILKKLAHIGLAVESIDDKLKLYHDVMGLETGERTEVPDQGVEVCFLELDNTKLELLQPLDDSANLNKFLQKKGEGIHHLCFEVEDIESALARLSEVGIQLIDKKPRVGACGELIAFLHPKSTGGVLIELEQHK
ncbi:MAG: methylmalonyl-CoA epimerase [candidate division Zixibacteria bacterium]|nr:methylmalonyl-CoA epimerase [candidate division Zixibacteria bacterium]